MPLSHLLPPTVLLVEDDPGIRETIREILAAEGYEVRAAANGREALDLLTERDRPGVILLDLWMPAMSGWDFLASARAAGLLAEVRVVVITALEVKTLPPDVDALVKKPMSLDELLAAVEPPAIPPRPLRSCNPTSGG